MHINLWVEYSDKRSAPFIDVGLKLTHIADIKKLWFYFPFKLKTADFFDLGSSFRDRTTVEAVFHNIFSVTSNGNNGELIQLTNLTDETSFTTYCLRSNDFHCVDDNGSTRMSIDLTATNALSRLDSKSSLYIRFRLNLPADAKLLHRRKSVDFFLRSAFSSSFYIDFRVNDKRTIPPSLSDTLKGDLVCEPLFNQIQFFLMTREDIDLVEHEGVRIRSLEKVIWEKYLNNSNSDEPNRRQVKLAKYGIIANQWSKMRNISNEGEKIMPFILYEKFQVQECNWLSVAVYILVITGLSIAANYLFMLISIM